MATKTKPTMDIVDLNDALTTKEVAAILKLKPGTLDSWRNRGFENQPPYVEISPRVIRYPRKQFIEWQRKQQLRGTSS